MYRLIVSLFVMLPLSPFAKCDDGVRIYFSNEYGQKVMTTDHYLKQNLLIADGLRSKGQKKSDAETVFLYYQGSLKDTCVEVSAWRELEQEKQTYYERREEVIQAFDIKWSSSDEACTYLMVYDKQKKLDVYQNGVTYARRESNAIVSEREGGSCSLASEPFIETTEKPLSTKENQYCEVAKFSIYADNHVDVDVYDDDEWWPIVLNTSGAFNDLTLDLEGEK